MSWEDHPPIYRACPCGKGQYAIIHSSDDWGRTAERWEMQCAPCSTVYGVHVTPFNHKGVREEQRRWVRQSSLRSVAKAERAVLTAQKNARSYMQRELRAPWLEYFAGKSKKEVWSVLTDDGSSYPALTTFYQHVRNSSVEAVLLSYLDVDHVQLVCKLLGTADKSLAKLMLEMHESEASLKKVQ